MDQKTSKCSSATLSNIAVNLVLLFGSPRSDSVVAQSKKGKEPRTDQASNKERRNLLNICSIHTCNTTKSPVHIEISPIFDKYSLVSTNASVHYWCRKLLGDSFCCLEGPRFSSFICFRKKGKWGWSPPRWISSGCVGPGSPCLLQQQESYCAMLASLSGQTGTFFFL